MTKSDVTHITRRDLLRTAGTGFGMVALSQLLAEDRPAGGPLAVKAPHFPAKAKNVIFLFLNGGPSHVDSFDHKPMLAKYDGQPFPGGNFETERKTGNLMRSPFKFKKYGQSGIEVSEIFPHLGATIDDICVIKSMHTDLPFHEPSLFMLNCGQRLPGYPSMGSWLTYGLGTVNRNLPGYVVMCPGIPVIGPQLWSSAFLPGVFQGTYIRTTETDPEELVPNLRNPRHGKSQQARQLALLSRLNRAHLKRAGSSPQLEAAIHSMELAYRMQSEGLDAFDVNRESEATRERYGDGDFARGCLLARRLVERGVRMVQIYFGHQQPWDTHQDIKGTMRRLALKSDQPMAELIKDLKARGLLEQTLVVIGGEFGRTPTVEVGGLVKVQAGRDDKNHGFSMLLAGGGVKGGMTYGNTDDFGFKAAEDPVHPNDLHATILRLMGFDHTRLTYRHSGRDFRLTDVEGEVIEKIIA